MKDINPTAKRTSSNDQDVYKNSTYYYINNKRIHENTYPYDPTVQTQAKGPVWGEKYDKEQVKIIWKKERNRLAAKKSRDKKAIQIRELEGRDRRMADDARMLRECIGDYDNVLSELFVYLEYVLSLNRDENRDDLILLFDCLCRLKKSGKENAYLTEISGLTEKPPRITNERIDSLTCKIRDCLRDSISKRNKGQDK